MRIYLKNYNYQPKGTCKQNIIRVGFHVKHPRSFLKPKFSKNVPACKQKGTCQERKVWVSGNSDRRKVKMTARVDLQGQARALHKQRKLRTQCLTGYRSLGV